MKSINDIYKRLLKDYPDWKIELDKNDNITLEKELFYIYANEDMVGISKRYSAFGFLDDHRHPKSIESMYNDIIYYIINKDILLKKQMQKDRIFVIFLVISIIVVILFCLMLK
ncbi:MAG: hypothetical protein IJL74_03025 [Bacilli bacterium]|nr:hypothetical protein [Bacilli bacterium]